MSAGTMAHDTRPGVAGSRIGWTRPLVFLVLYFALTLYVAHASLHVQSLVLVAAVFAVLAISLDLVAGMLGLYSLGQGGFFAIGAYLTTLVSNRYGTNVFLLLPAVLIVAGLAGAVVGAASLRVGGLYFAITTFVFTLVLTVMAIDFPQITGGTQGLLGPMLPDFPRVASPLGSSVAWCIMLALLLVIALVWNIRRSPLYPVLLSIRDAEPYAEAAGVRTARFKVGIFALSAAIAGGAGWLFSFLGIISPGQFSWAVSLNILVMVLIGGINTTFGPVIGAIFVSMFPAVVNINPWLQEVLYGGLSILAVTVLPEGVVGLARKLDFRAAPAPVAPGADVANKPAPLAATTPTNSTPPSDEIIVECRNIDFGYGVGHRVLRNVDFAVRRGHIHGLIGPNGSGKTTLANIIAGRLRQQSGTTLIKGQAVNDVPPSGRAKLGLRRTFQAAQLVRDLTPTRNVMVGLFDLVPGIVRRAPLWPLLRSGRRDGARMHERSARELTALGAGGWVDRRIGDVPHGIEQLTQLASVSVAAPDLIILDEPATGLSISEVEHLARVLAGFKAQGVTMIIIEHQTRFLFPLCDKLTVLNAGEVIMTGTADEVRADPVVRQVYLGQ